MQKKFTFLVFLLLAAALGIQAQSLLLKAKDGTVTTKELGTVKRFTFSNNNLLVNYLSGPVETYALTNISKLSFKLPPTGTNQLNLSGTETIKIYPNPASDVIYIQNAPKTDFTVSIYRINGVVLNSTVMNAGSKTIDVSYLPGGLYLLRINNQAIKFIKR